jgi:PEP-CTERM putative exosortase interaction domain
MARSVLAYQGDVCPTHGTSNEAKSMNPVRMLLGCVLVLSSALGVYADGISPDDPQIIVGRGSGSTAVTTFQFSVPIGPNGGGIFDFDNRSGQDWVGLILTVTFPTAADAMAAVSCSSSIFTTCGSSRHGRIVTITFTGGEITDCSASPCSLDSEFFLDLNNADSLSNHGHANGDGKGNWKNDTISGQAITTPEPTTLPLLLAGLGGIYLWRKRG